jgi:hypothetical protein
MTKPQMQRLSWERKEDKGWASSVEARLELDYDAPVELCDQVLAEVHEVVSEDGGGRHASCSAIPTPTRVPPATSTSARNAGRESTPMGTPPVSGSLSISGMSAIGWPSVWSLLG